METESKFIVPSEAAFARLRAIDIFGKYERRDERTKEVHDRYLDTPHQDFLNRGWCFRLREGKEGDLLITLKSLQRHALGTDETSTAIQVRDEYETSVTGLKIASWPDSEAKDLAKEIAGKQAMRDLVTVDQVRTVSRLYDGERAVAELSLDEVEFLAGAGADSDGPAHKTYELEAELLPDGTIEDMLALTQIFAEEYGLDPQPQSKFEQALRIADFSDQGEAKVETPKAKRQTSKQPKARTSKALQDTLEAIVEAADTADKGDGAEGAPAEAGATQELPAKPHNPRAEIRNTDSMADAARKLIGHNYKAMGNNEEGARLGEDPMAIHDMRVATRRMRAAFRVFDPYLTGKRAKDVKEGLRVVATDLGTVRDLDVQIENAEAFRETLAIDQRAGLASMSEEWRVARWKARKALVRLLNSKEYAQFKRDMERFLDETSDAPDQAEGAQPYQVRHIAGGVILSRYEALRAIEALPDAPTITQLHALRIVGKYFRYTLEFFRDVLPKEVSAMIRDVVKLQDQLGEMHDADVAATLVRDYSSQYLKKHALNVKGTPDNHSEQSSNVPAGLAAYLESLEEIVRRKQVEYEKTWIALTNADWRTKLAILIAG